MAKADNTVKPESAIAGWRPEAGEEVTGIITDLNMGDSEFGKYPILTLKTEDKEVAIHAFHKILRSELIRIRPKVGHEVTVKYFGLTEEGGKYGNGYELYKVTSPQYVFDWDRVPTAANSTEPDVFGEPPF